MMDLRRMRNDVLPFVLISALLLSVGAAARNAQDQPDWLDLGSRVEASEISESQVPVLVEWLDRYGQGPVDYAVETCRRHQIVIFGELHGAKDYLDLFLLLIPRAYHEAGMRYVALEAAKFADNEKIARLLQGKVFDRELALEVARNAGRSTWSYKEYWGVFEVVWILNRSLPPEAEPMKVIGLDVDADLELSWLWLQNRLKDPQLVAQAQRESLLIERRDELMASAVDLTIIRRGAKGMVWVGWNHAFTHYAQPRVNREGVLFGEFQRMGALLHQRYGERIFQIAFHSQDNSPRDLLNDYRGPDPVFFKWLESVMARRNGRAVGFDVFVSPFGQVRDRHSYYFHFQPRVTFADLCRGFIFLKPWAEIASCGRIKDFVTEEMFLKRRTYYEAVYKRTFKDVREFNDWLEAR